mmetsp:Transcript_40877/g.57492  ORF Transcript_40877/g.57492 Transcript_40877/m.57492 type:complete len:237 (+) Transcript_40877:76-786(+)
MNAVVTSLLSHSLDGSGDGHVTVTIDILTVALVCALILYSWLFVVSSRKLWNLHCRQPRLTTQKLLLLSVWTVCLIRIMTISGVAAMNAENVRAHYSLEPNSSRAKMTPQQEFYDKAMTVLFDLPNSMVVSTYILLILVWAECFLESRLHTQSLLEWKKFWLLGYTIFNSLLYATQLTIYIWILFFAPPSRLRFLLYSAITGVNFFAVLLVLILIVYLNLQFSVSPGKYCCDNRDV